MDTPILATKLYIPPPPPKGVRRPRLMERLNAGLHRKLTLISAPAGFGKTSLVSEWLAGEWVAGCSRQGVLKGCAAWLSLDEADSDPVRFLTYLVAALRTAAPDIGEQVLDALQSAPLLIEPILTALLNELTTIPGKFVLVLDDYHVLDTRSLDAARSVDAAVAFLLEHLPPQMHLVITTREDPQLPLARLRARDQLTELRASDLRFTPEEAAGFLQTMHLNLSTEDVAALEDRTEGWIAGLQLAGLALQGALALQDAQAVQGQAGQTKTSPPDHAGVPEFIRAFAGDHRYIVDYLVEEVLQRQPDDIRSFLLQTAILDRLNGALCDAVTGQAGGSARLEALQRGNFFVIPLDDQRHWYRYHHLFADVLRMHLLAEQPEQVAALHLRASGWYEQHGAPADAIRHALAAADYERAADLIERAFPAMSRSRQEATMLGWLKELPEALVRERPVLCDLYAGVLLQSGEIQHVDAWLLAAERGLSRIGERRDRSDAPPSSIAVLDPEEFHRLPGSVAVHRAGLALIFGNVDETIHYARQALDLISDADHLGHGAAAGLLGLAYWTTGDLEAACRLYAESMTRLQKAGHTSDSIGLTIALAVIQMTQGCLGEAMRTYTRGLQLATGQGAPVLRGAADMHVGMSEIYRERGDLDAAMQHLLSSQELGAFNGLPQNPYRWRVAMARIRAAQGDQDAALDLLEEAERLYASDLFPNVHPIAAVKARVWVTLGRLGDALEWAREQDLSAAGELSYLREFEHITLARLLLAQYQRDGTDRSIHEAIGLLERLLQAAQAGGRTGSLIEILVLQALAHQALGDIPAALAPLERALSLAEPEGYIRIFVDEGLPMAQLLREASAREIFPGYTGKLLAALESEQPRGAGDAALPTSTASQRRFEPAKTGPVDPEDQPAKTSLVDPLSQRELEVLRLFKTELSGPEIAQELMIGLSTVRTHTKSIFSKLNVNNRRAAVKRAAELHLI